MTTHWVCEKFDAESCDNVETEAQRRLKSQNYLEAVFGRNVVSLLPEQRLVPPEQATGFVESLMMSHVTELKR